MFFLVGLIIGIAMAKISSSRRDGTSRDSDGQSQAGYPADCLYHSWQYNKEDRLQCTICEKYPGEV